MTKIHNCNHFSPLRYVDRELIDISKGFAARERFLGQRIVAGLAERASDIGGSGQDRYFAMKTYSIITHALPQQG